MFVRHTRTTQKVETRRQRRRYLSQLVSRMEYFNTANLLNYIFTDRVSYANVLQTTKIGRKRDKYRSVEVVGVGVWV